MFALTAIKTAFVIILRALMTQQMMIRVMIHLGDYLVKMSDNKLDDRIWPDLKEALKGSLK